MNKPAITLSDGTPLNLGENQLNPLVGYQIHNRITGRLLPTCTRIEYYTLAAMSRVFTRLYVERVVTCAHEWIFVPFYQSEIEDKEYIIITKTDLL